MDMRGAKNIIIFMNLSHAVSYFCPAITQPIKLNPCNLFKNTFCSQAEELLTLLTYVMNTFHTNIQKYHLKLQFSYTVELQYIKNVSNRGL